MGLVRTDCHWSPAYFSVPDRVFCSRRGRRHQAALRSPFLLQRIPSAFLHELPGPALQNVVQHLSSKPGRANWPHFVDMDDALKAVHPCNPLRGVAQDVFTYLNTIPHYCGDGRWICLPDDTSPSLLTKWFQYAGSSLTELSLSGRITGQRSTSHRINTGSRRRKLQGLGTSGHTQHVLRSAASRPSFQEEHGQQTTSPRLVSSEPRLIGCSQDEGTIETSV